LLLKKNKLSIFAKKKDTQKNALEFNDTYRFSFTEETNPLNKPFGGELLARMDRAARLAARRHLLRRITVG
jgi:acyl-CoA hydrolase